jgi:peptidoglycan/xylan/chitin deacetylase (PgdA/CDA1 family)
MEPVVYLTFDDGPTPEVTAFVLELLKSFDFKATFFCIGDCVKKHPAIYKDVLQQGHAVGNHTHNHLNSWSVLRSRYVRNVDKAARFIESNLFRPPYGKLSYRKYKAILERGYEIVLWDVLSGDFDKNRKPASILENLYANTQNGSIIVFHDSKKCFETLKEVLPAYFSFLKEKGLTSKSLV